MPLVLRVVSGYDGAVLAYGPQGSGKSYTLFAADQAAVAAPQFGESACMRSGRGLSWE